MTNDKKALPSIFKSNILFLFIMITFIISSYLVSLTNYNNFYYNALLTEYLLYLLPVILYLIYNKYDLKHFLRLNKLSGKQLILIPLITICGCFISAFLNNIILLILSLFGEFNEISRNIPSGSSISELIILLLVVALTPGICEEVLFRGFIMRCYEQIGVKKAIILSGILFGIFHINLNIQGLLGLSFLGMLCGYLVFKTNSLFASMLAHFVHNSFSQITKYTSVSLSSNTVESISFKEILPVVLFSAVIALIAGILCFILLKLLPKSESNAILINDTDKTKTSIKDNFIQYSPLLAIILLYIYWCFKV